MMEAAMLEDFRGHDPNPTVHERAWMEANPYPVVFRVAVLAAIAVLVGLSVGHDETGSRPIVTVVTAGMT
jgi:hypothetical protein